MDNGRPRFFTGLVSIRHRWYGIRIAGQLSRGVIVILS